MLLLQEIVTPILIVTGLGISLGTILSIMSYFMEVHESEKARAIHESLPGVNCGGCGYVGCEEYAKALSEGNNVKVNLCTPGGNETAELIANILRTDVEVVEPKTAHVKCQGARSVASCKMIYKGVESCRGAGMYYGSINYCTEGCIGYGDCKDACIFQAIEFIDGVAHIINDKCTGCGACVSSCPKGIIILSSGNIKARIMCANKDPGRTTRKICSIGCIACGICVRNCEYDAISIFDNLAVVDEDLCTGCGLCVSVCPAKVIRLY